MENISADKIKLVYFFLRLEQRITEKHCAQTTHTPPVLPFPPFPIPLPIHRVKKAKAENH